MRALAQSSSISTAGRLLCPSVAFFLVGRFYFDVPGASECVDENLCHEMPEPLPKSCSLWRWASSLVRFVLPTRTSFAAFLQTTFSLHRSSEPATAIFPIPAPYVGAFDRRPRETSSSRRTRLVCQVLHIMAMALNFWRSGGRFFSKDQLERKPSSLHMFRRWRRLLLADGPRGVFEIASSGRRFPQLGARINELSDVLTKLGLLGGLMLMPFLVMMRL